MLRHLLRLLTAVVVSMHLLIPAFAEGRTGSNWVEQAKDALAVVTAASLMAKAPATEIKAKKTKTGGLSRGRTQAGRRRLRCQTWRTCWRQRALLPATKIRKGDASMKTAFAPFAGTLKLFVVCLAVGLHTGPSAAQSPQARQFVPGELLIGYKSASDKNKAVQDLSNAQRKGGMRTRSGGQSDNLTVEPFSETAIKLKLDFRTAKRSKPSPQEELDFLLETARQLKESNDSIRYAHPNWIMTLDPGPSIPLDPDKLKLRRQSAPQGLGSEPNDVVYRAGLHWNYDAPPAGMNAVEAWRYKNKGGQYTRGSRDIVVAVVDSGILFKHPDLKGSGNVLPGYDFISDPAAARDGDGRDPDATDEGTECPANPETRQIWRPSSWHGSHVAGTIGAATNNKKAIAGVNWQVSILPVRVLGKCGRGSVLDVADAIKWAAGLPVPGIPMNPTPAHVINLSFGGPPACTEEEAGYKLDSVRAARKAGAVVVVAAGNNSDDLANYSPASCEGVISVTASDRRGRLTSYSNYGAATIMAPGGNVYSDVDKDGFKDGIWSLVRTDRFNLDSVAGYQGTSMAAPHVSAAIALAMANNASLRKNPDLVERAIKRTAAKLAPGQCSKRCFLPQYCPADCGADVCPVNCGAGQLDALELLKFVIED